MVDKVSCPCGGVAHLTHKPCELIMYKVEKQIFDWYYYECEDCGQLWTTTESDTKSYENIDFTEHE